MHIKAPSYDIHDVVASCNIFEKILKEYLTFKGVYADTSYQKTIEEFIQK